jgi:hypothetical protein
MKLFSCIVRDLFHTSIGEIFVLQFSSEIVPKVGLLLENNNGVKWKIIGLGMNSKFHNPNNKYATNNNPNLLWDCSLAPNNHNEILHKGDTLRFVLESK